MKYTVKEGDTLSKLAKRFYGDPSDYDIIYDANKEKLPNPDTVWPGLEIEIPGAGKSLEDETSDENGGSENIKYGIVAGGIALAGIAAALYMT